MFDVRIRTRDEPAGMNSLHKSSELERNDISVIDINEGESDASLSGGSNQETA